MRRCALVCVIGISILPFIAIVDSGPYAKRQGAPALPVVTAALVPLYPSVAELTSKEGVIHVRVRTDGRRVVDAHAEEDLKPLSTSAEDNAKTWEFAVHTPVSFTITYHYRLRKECAPDNPTVTLRLPTDVDICQYPFHEY